MKTQLTKLVFGKSSIIELQKQEMNKINGGTGTITPATPALVDLIDHLQNCGQGEDMCNGHTGQQ